MIVLRVRGAQEPCVPSIAPSKPPVTSPSPPPTTTPFPQLAIKNSVGLVVVGGARFESGGEGSGGGEIALGAKKCCRGVFTTADVWLSSCSHWISPLQDAGQNVCEDTQPSQWLFRKREKKMRGEEGGGPEWRPPPCHVVPQPPEQGGRRQWAPICGRPHPRGSISVGARGATMGSKTGVP